MADVVSIESLERDGDRCFVNAYVDDVVMVFPASYQEPAEYGPALCRGSFYLQDDEVIPEDDAERCEFVADRVDYWNVLDFSDC